MLDLSELGLADDADDGVGGARWMCEICGFVYDQALGLPEDGIAPGTAWDALPADWSCPDCGMAKSDFSMVLVD